MSGPGSPELTVTGAANLRVGVVAGRWHARFADALLAGARRALAEHGIEEPTVVAVPGSFELPVVAKRLAGIGYDAVVALGVVIRGETPHFDYVCQAVAVGLSHVAVDTGVPVGFGVLTCDTPEQAADRCGLPGSREDKGYDTAMAAIATALAVRRTQEWR